MPRISRRFLPSLCALEGRVALSGDLLIADPTLAPVVPPSDWLGGTGDLTEYDPVLTPMDPVIIGWDEYQADLSALDAAQAAADAEWADGTGGGEGWPLPIVY